MSHGCDNHMSSQLGKEAETPKSGCPPGWDASKKRQVPCVWSTDVFGDQEKSMPVFELRCMAPAGMVREEVKIM